MAGDLKSYVKSADNGITVCVTFVARVLCGPTKLNGHVRYR